MESATIMGVKVVVGPSPEQVFSSGFRFFILGLGSFQKNSELHPRRVFEWPSSSQSILGRKKPGKQEVHVREPNKTGEQIQSANSPETICQCRPFSTMPR